MTSLTSATQKEQFSLAFCHAVATVAGFSMEEIRVDVDSVDFTILSSDTDGLLKKPRLDVQLKCTARPALLEPASELSFALDQKNYDDLRIPRHEVMCPRLLVVVVVPDSPDDWLKASDEEMCLRQSAYWHSLAGAPPNANTYSSNVRIPISQRFTPIELRALMQRAANGQL